MSSPLPFTAHDLIQHVTHDLSCCDALLAVLTEEEDALTKRESERVEQLLEQKVPLLEKLETSMNTRKQWVQNSGSFDGSKKAWDLLIGKLDQRELKEKWQTLQTRYQQVRDQNAVNGKLLSRHQQTVSRVLDLMRGKNLAPNLYTASGQTSNRSSSNLFGEA
jgi:flagellar biosynthesis/type III secretory pathway chaperone